MQHAGARRGLVTGVLLLAACHSHPLGGPPDASQSVPPGRDTGAAPEIDAGQVTVDAGSLVSEGGPGSVFSDGGPGSGTPDVATDAAPVLGVCTSGPGGPAPLRRLSNAQYLRSLRDLLGFTPTTALPPENNLNGWEDRVDLQSPSSELVVAWNQIA